MKMKRMGIILSLFIMTVIISGCGAKEEKSMYMEETYAAADYGYYTDTYAALPETATEGIGDKTGYSTMTGFEENGSDLNLDSIVQERKLIRNVNVSLETEKYDTVNANIKAKITENGGYIENYSEYRGNYYNSSNRSSDITARIPAEKVDEFLNKGFQDAYITSMSENTQDVTLQYSDLETKLASLTTERDRLLELMKKAEDIDSIIAIEERLTQVRYELESIQSSLKNYDNQVNFSTVWISLCEVKKIEASEEATFIERIKTGFVKSTAELAEGLKNFAVWFISNIVSIVLFAVLVFVIIKVFRHISEKAKVKKENKANESKNGGSEKETGES